MNVVLVVLGMFVDWVGILFLAVPIFVPLMKTLPWGGVFGLPGVDPREVPLWFGVVYMVNMQMSFLSPPFGDALFYLKSVAPPEVTMAITFRSAVPFLAIQALGLAICIIFPEIILWLPRLVYGPEGSPRHTASGRPPALTHTIHRSAVGGGASRG